MCFVIVEYGIWEYVRIIFNDIFQHLLERKSRQERKKLKLSPWLYEISENYEAILWFSSEHT